MKLPPLDYIRPGTVTEALKVWSDREVMFLAGGQGLLSEMGQGLRRPATLADISAIPELGTIEITPDGSMLRAGAAVRLGQLAGHPALRGSLLAAAARHVGVPPIRALATVGGNFCHGHPTSELPLAALVAGASLVGFRRDGTEVTFTGPELAALRPAGDCSEVLLTALEWPVHGNGHAAGFAELGEQRSWVPAAALAWLADHRATPAQPTPQARIGVALRDGGRFLVRRAEGIPCTAASVGQAAASAATATAAVRTDLPASWLADLINELLGEDAEPERM